MAKVKKYLAAFLATVMTVSLIVIPGAVGVSAATANDTVNEASNSQEGYVSFLEKSPNPVNDGTVKGASVSTQDTSNNYAFLKQLDVTVTDAASFNTAGSWFWFNGVNWQNKYDDLSQISKNGYLEFWVKATAAVEFEVRLSATYGYYTHTVKVETVGEWQKLKLRFINFKAGEYAKTTLLSHLAGIKIVFGANNLTANDSVSFGSMSFYTDNNAGIKLAASAANLYSYKYLSLIEDMPLSGGNSAVFDQEVPFCQIVLHGSMDYSTSAINNESDEETAVLKAIETGSGLHYILNKNIENSLFDTDSTALFSSSFDSNAENAAAAYNSVLKALDGLNDKKIVNHYYIGDVAVTVYENGSRIFVNYSDSDAKADNITVPARGWVRAD